MVEPTDLKRYAEVKFGNRFPKIPGEHPKNPDTSRSNRIFRVPIPSLGHRIIEEILSLGDTWILRDIKINHMKPGMSSPQRATWQHLRCRSVRGTSALPCRLRVPNEFIGSFLRGMWVSWRTYSTPRLPNKHLGLWDMTRKACFSYTNSENWSMFSSCNPVYLSKLRLIIIHRAKKMFRNMFRVGFFHWHPP